MSNAGESFAQGTVAAFRIVFSLPFPLILIMTFIASPILMALGFTQFALVFGLAAVTVEFATSHWWAALGVIAFAASAWPLTRIAYREHATRASSVIGNWIAFAIVGGLTISLLILWPPDGSTSQALVFAVLLFGVCGGICDAVLSTLKLREMTRPRPGPEVVVAQKAHGDARLADEAEAVALLNSKK